MTEHQLDMQFPDIEQAEHHSVTVDDITVSIFRSPIDGKTYVQIDTSEMADHDESCNVRVYYNDAIAIEWGDDD